MSKKRLLAVTGLFTLAVLGTWLIFGSSSIAPEAAERQDSIFRAMAPSLGDAGEGSNGGAGGFADPITVQMDKLTLDAGIGESQYERWLRGEIDVDEHERPISAAAWRQRQIDALSMAPGANVTVLQPSSLGLESTTVLTSFDSIDIDDCCVSGGNVPPDPEMAAGPDHVIAVVNVAFEIYDTDGTSLSGPTTFASFMAGDPNCTGVFDPNVLYDEEADRFMLAIDADGDFYCVAVSQTGDPTGSWNLYSFAMDINSDDFFDYPHAGVGDDAIYMGANIFTDALAFRESRVYAFDKAAMYAGGTAQFVVQSVGQSFTPQPINLHGFAQGTWPTGEPHHFIASEDFDGSGFSIFAWDDPFGTNSLTEAGTIDLNSVIGNDAGGVLEAPNLDAVDNLDAGDNRPLDFEYRNGSGWTTLTISCNPGGGAVNCVRWAQIDLDSYAVVQAGDLSSEGDYRFYPDLAVNHCGDMAVGYTKSSVASYAGVYATGREFYDPLGTVQAEVELKAGEAPYAAFDGNPLRWGDYTGMTIGPDGTTFWYLGEYAKSGVTSTAANWGNWIAAMEFPECTVEPDFQLVVETPSLEACIPDDADFTLDVNAFLGFSENVTLSSSNEPAGTSTSFSVNPVAPSGSSVMTVDTTSATAGNYEFNVVGTSTSQVHTTTVGLDLYSAPPTAVPLLSPPDTATRQSIAPLLTWSASAGATSYDVEVATDSGFTNIVYTANGVVETSHQVADQLMLATTYYWRVTPTNVCGTAAPAAAFQFTTIGDGLSCPAGMITTYNYWEDFESGAAGWTHAATVGPDTWMLSNANPGPGSGGFNYFAVDHTAPSDQRLTSPVIELPSSAINLSLQFYNDQRFENPAGSGGCWDGGIVEISSDGGSNWDLLNFELLSDPYDGLGNNGPPTNIPMWCGETNGIQPWLNSIVDLSAYDGDDVQLRFGMLTDAAAGGPGWRIDDVRISSCVDATYNYLPIVTND